MNIHDSGDDKELINPLCNLVCAEAEKRCTYNIIL